MTTVGAAPSAPLLPPRPQHLADRSVAAWSAPVTWPTYLPAEPDRFPAYLDRRVYQGSSGAVYPLPMHDRIAAEPVEHAWSALHLENEYVRVVVLPELGGRLQLAIDRRTGYSLFYDPGVIKPALVGLAGPWLAGGVEFNWPQHHRPATFLPCAWDIEETPDSVTVWLSDHDPMTRMKGMHGVRLSAGVAAVDLDVRLYNRTDAPQTFLWWANAAVTAHDDYQTCFPGDVHLVADHAKRAVTTFPVPSGSYYGIDYPSRHDLDTRPGSSLRVPGDRLDWGRNIPVPTSYMCLGSEQDFFGGYDHRAGAGVVHWADHHYAVGKKQWTWGEDAFGRAWNANLADDGSAYLELMAGVYTDNQPDFAHLAPGETKVFTQRWFPVGGTGAVVAAGRDLALGCAPAVADPVDGVRPDADAEAGADADPRWTLVATRELEVSITVRPPGGAPLSATVALGPQQSWRHDGPLDELRVESEGELLLAWAADPNTAADPSQPDLETLSGEGAAAVAPAEEPPAPDQLDTVDELYRTGLHLAQYRHATRSPEPYWTEAVRRDPGHPGARVALAWRRYAEARYPEAEQHLRAAVARLTRLNPNPPDGEAHYLLGLVLDRLGREHEAYAAFATASWLRAWVAPASFQLAVLDARAGRNLRALERSAAVLRVEPDHLQAAAVRVVVLRRLGRMEEAADTLDDLARRDRLHVWTRDLRDEASPENGLAEAQTLIDVALEYARIGDPADAVRLLAEAAVRDEQRPLGQTACLPLTYYHTAAIWQRLGCAAAERHRALGAAAPRGWVFPSRLDDVAALQDALRHDPQDATAAALLGHWLYAHRRPGDAVQAWRRSFDAEPADGGDPVVARNLGVAAYNHERDPDAAQQAYARALALAPDDPRLWYESDQLLARVGATPDDRLQRLADAPAGTPAARDDLATVHAHLLTGAGRAREALALLAGRGFQPWEGGEGEVLRAWERACLALAAESSTPPADRVRHVAAAIDPPASLGEARHPLANTARLFLALGDARAATGDAAGARDAWATAARADGDFTAMATRPYSPLTAYAIRAARRLGDDRTTERLLDGLAAYTETLADTPAVIDYFATSLPTLVLFHDDPQREQDDTVLLLRAQTAWLRGDTERARGLLDDLLARRPDDDLGLDLARHLDAEDSR